MKNKLLVLGVHEHLGVSKQAKESVETRGLAVYCSTPPQDERKRKGMLEDGNRRGK